MPSDFLPPLPVPSLLEVHEVSRVLKCSPETVRRFIREGELVAVGLTERAWRVDPLDLKAFIDTRKTTTNGNGNGHRIESPGSGDQA